MKARFSEEYYRNNWERFMKPSNERGYINLEEKLQYQLRIFTELPEEAFKLVEKMKAQEIADEFTASLKATMAEIKEIEAGKASLGYTNQLQEAQVMGRLVTRFEFNCLQLADFKKAHLS